MREQEPQQVPEQEQQRQEPDEYQEKMLLVMMTHYSCALAPDATG